MSKTQHATLEQVIHAALQGVTDLTDLGDSILSPDHFDQYVRTVQDEAVWLDDSRFEQMDSHRVRIDRIGFGERIMVPGRENSGDDHRDIPDSEVAVPTFDDVELIARELVAVTALRDHAVRRSIERGNLEDTLIAIFGEAAARDLEEYALLAGTTDGDAFLEQTDGWIASAANTVYSGDVNADDPEDVFDKAIEATPTRFIANPAEWEIAVDFTLYRKYLEVLRERQTPLGDEAQTGRIPLAYEGFGVRYVPMLERAKSVLDDGPGRVAVMAHPDNRIWGVFHEVTVEPFRKPRDRKTEFTLVTEVDAKWEDPNGATVVYLEKESA